MKKLLLVGNTSERPALMKLLNKEGCVEISATPPIDGAVYCDKNNQIEIIERDLTALNYFIDIVSENSKEAKKLAKERLIEYVQEKKIPFAPRPEIEFEKLEYALFLREELFLKIKELEELTAEKLQLKAEEGKIFSLNEQVIPYKNVKRPFDYFTDTKTVNVLFGLIPQSSIPIMAKIEEKGGVAEVYIDEQKGNVAVCIIIPKDIKENITSDLSESGFTACNLNYNLNAMDIIESNKEKLNEIAKRNLEIIQEICKYDKDLGNAKLLYDYLLLEKRKLECETITRSTQTSYFLEAWIPTVKEEKVAATLDNSNLTLAFETRDPQEGEVVPSYVENNGIVDPYQSVTNMFSAPAYGEIDPNPFVAFFFFLFFGMMLSDAGYGLILTLGTGILLAINKPPKGQSNLLKIVFMGGVSTILWGIVFGSYFGISAKDMNIWYWFNPIEDPMYMLYLSLAMGIFQMCFGLGINMVALFKQKKPIDAIAGSFSWYFLIIGIALAFGSGMLIKNRESLVQGLKIAGYILLVIGALLLMLSGALHKKGSKVVTGALARLYDIINFFSDLMSYTRIFGLGLATAVIGMVFNQIGMLIANMVPIKVIGWIAACVIFLIGHIFNLAINALGAYVHNSRLQFVEFFGKFYTGGGRLFRPLGSEIKYYIVKSEEVRK